MRRARALWLLLSTTALACGPKGPAPATAPAASASASASPSRPELGEGDGALLRDADDERDVAPEDAPAKPQPRVGLDGGLAALDASEYATARVELKKAAIGKDKGRALVGLARIELETGAYDEAVKTADEAAREGKDARRDAAWVKARALARQGKVELAIKAVDAVKDDPDARRARVVLGELLLRQGKTQDAQAPLMSLIDDFNQKRITTRDGEGMMLVGRAAHLLRSKRDSNEAYDDAERAGNKSPELFLYRASLFLEAENIGRAHEMVREAKKRAPEWPAAHALEAQVKLDQALDFDAAELSLQRALAVNPRLTEARFIRAGIALRDMELERADAVIADGLAIDPTDLDLLSIRAASRFLADDKPGFQRAIKAVLDLNPVYARMYHVIATHADWEHRYAEIVAMMGDATKLDPDDGKLWVTLGLNQIRLGRDKDALVSLDRGFRLDKFNVRAFNTLNLYERDIPEKYDDVDGPIFRLRYPKAERKVLERYVPRLLDDAWNDMRARYGFTPRTPIGVELYGTREHFSVRTSGLPNIGIQGVCFGETLAAISPKAEPFNWGMVLWHEVGHVFAIQLSNNHVPRWFTEGLSEYETLARRPEWSREEDPALWLALKRGKVPTLEQMNRAFTHADDMRDVATAYYASSQISVFLVEKFGMPKLVKMLKLWGEGERTPEVVQTALGVSADALDGQFRAWLDARLSRYKGQYVPDLRPRDLKGAEAAVAKDPKDPKALVDLALARIARGDRPGAEGLLQRASEAAPKHPDVRYLKAKLTLKKNPAFAQKELDAMVAEGNDGFAVRIMLADAALAQKDAKKAAEHFKAATRLDPSQAEPWQALADLAKKAKDDDAELAALERLALLDQHDRRVARRLLAKYVSRRDWPHAVKTGEGAIYVDVHGAETHTLYAEALFEKGDVDKARFEADSALLCEPLKANVASRANVVLARVFSRKGDAAKARAAKDEALRQDPTNRDAVGLPLRRGSVLPHSSRARRATARLELRAGLSGSW